MASRIKGEVPVSVNDVLDGHVKLDLECLDRVYLHGYLGRLQVSGQLVQFLKHRGYPIPFGACLQQIGDAFRRRVASFAEANHIPVVALKAADRNIEVMQPYLDAAARTGRSQVAAIGVAQEPQRVFIARKRDTDPSRCPQFSFDKKDRRVTVYYFYLHDADFGPAFIKICTYCPWPVKIWVNGHEWSKQQARKLGLGFTELSNGFAACDDPALLQRICDALQPGTIEVFFQRWLHRLPLPLAAADRDAGWWWELSAQPSNSYRQRVARQRQTYSARKRSSRSSRRGCQRPRPAEFKGASIPLADPVQMIWDLQDLGGADRAEAAGKLRQWLLNRRRGGRPRVCQGSRLELRAAWRPASCESLPARTRGAPHHFAARVGRRGRAGHGRRPRARQALRSTTTALEPEPEFFVVCTDGRNGLPTVGLALAQAGVVRARAACSCAVIASAPRRLHWMSSAMRIHAAKMIGFYALRCLRWPVRVWLDLRSPRVRWRAPCSNWLMSSGSTGGWPAGSQQPGLVRGSPGSGMSRIS